MLINNQLVIIIGQKIGKIFLLLIIGEFAKKSIYFLIKRVRITSEKINKESLQQQKQRLKTITNLIYNSAKFIINFIVLIMILAEFGLNIAPLITGAGILGLAVGFGAKSLVADFIAGFFIILENMFNVGDEIILAGKQGQVIKITLRTVTLKDKNNKTYIIPNSIIRTVVKLSKKKSVVQ